MLLLSQIALPTSRELSECGYVRNCQRRRAWGFGLGGLCVGAVLLGNAALPPVWALLAINVLVWPLLARWLMLHSRDAHAAETRNLLLDSACGGVWIALMQFNLLPSVLLAVSLAGDKAMVGGGRLLTRSVIVQIAACVLTLAVHGLAFMPTTTMPEIAAALPLLIAYPLSIAAALYVLTRQRANAHPQCAHGNTDTSAQVA